MTIASSSISISVRQSIILCLLLFSFVLSACDRPPETQLHGESKEQAGDIKSSCSKLVDAAKLPSCPGDEKCLSVEYQGKQIGVSGWVLNKVEEKLEEGYETAFDALITDSGWKKIVSALMTMAIIFFAMSAILGFINVSPYGTVMVIAKIMLVYAFAASDEARELFDQYVITFVEDEIIKGVSQGLGEAFVSGSGQSVLGITGTGVGSYAVVDNYISLFFSTSFWKIIYATTLTGIFGWFYAAAIIGMIVMYIFVLIRSLYIYLIAQLARYLLYIIAPIFIVMALFSQTRHFI